jgi:hypothetical protein
MISPLCREKSLEGPLTYYVTRFALTRGILRAQEDLARNCAGSRYVWVRWPCKAGALRFTRTEAFLTPDAAKERVKDMVRRKVQSLRAQVLRLEKATLKGVVTSDAFDDDR